jgi:O-acetyl-ADP-ribose deacetylase
VPARWSCGGPKSSPKTEPSARARTLPAILIVEQGDISDFDGDAIVNAANNHLILGTGVAGAIARRGGPSIQLKCDEYVRAHGPIRVGEAAVTGSGGLSVDVVIHAAAMGDEPVSSDSIRKATRHAIELSRAKACHSIAFPILGSGVGGFSFAQAARLMVEVIRELTEHSELPRSVVLYGYTDQQAQALRALLR